MQCRTTGAIKCPHSLAQLDHMTVSQNTTLEPGLCAAVWIAWKYRATGCLKAYSPIRSEDVPYRQGYITLLARYGWQVGLSAVRLTASEYLDSNVGDDRVHVLCSGT